MSTAWNQVLYFIEKIYQYFCDQIKTICDKINSNKNVASGLGCLSAHLLA